MEIAKDWKDYKIIDMANGEKLEKWADVSLIRPDPQIIWSDKTFEKNGIKQMQDMLEVLQVEENGIIIREYQKLGKLSIRI